MKKEPFIILFVVVIMTTIGLIIGLNYDKIAGLFDSKPTEQEIIPTKTITAYDVVAQRRLEIELRKVDSIYYSIPEPALIEIIDYFGIDKASSREAIVAQYVKEALYYKGIVLGAKNSKHYIPDSIPRSATPSIPMPVITDTLRR